MQRFTIKFAVMAVMLLGLPLFGVHLAGYPIARYIEFPPESRYVQHAPFSWAAFCAYSAFILVVTLPLIITAVRTMRRRQPKAPAAAAFPWWGWLGVVWGLLFWILAWTRFEWFAVLQPHTFTFLWLGYILFIHGLGQRQTGRCMLTARPGYFLMLFPASAAFWWFFEYLNRFVQNWYYEGVRFGPAEYFWYATLSFATVLPAVLGTRDVVLGTRWLQDGFKQFLPLAWPRPRVTARAVLIAASAGLALIGVFPNLMFPLLWVSPLLIIVSLQVLMSESHIFMDISRGDWRQVMACAAAALICGWFWEMWNYFSLARWVYAVPYVHRFEVFEMPILGFAGYLPFGLECAVIGTLLERLKVSF